MTDLERRNLERANRIIGWMMPYIGVMCPPENGLRDLNEHCCDNVVPDPKRTADDAPLGQSKLQTRLSQNEAPQFVGKCQIVLSQKEGRRVDRMLARGR